MSEEINGWKTQTLGSVIELIGGGTPKTSILEYWNGDIPWLSVVDFNVKNKYVFDTLPQTELEKTVFLTPSYIYPDSLIKEFYEPIVWGQSFIPKLVTITKKFTLSKEGGDAVQELIK